MRNGGTLPAYVGLAIACTTIALGGCADSNLGTVSGTVTYEGTPVENGNITFLPVDGLGEPAGGPITAGAYTVTEVPPGKKIVEVIAVEEVDVALSTEDMARRAAEAQTRGDRPGAIEPADVVPPNAAGNNQQHDVVAGDQKLDLTLTKPGA